MAPQEAAVAILFLCLLLVAQAFFLGREVGASGALRAHPGYTTLPAPGSA